ncbi:MAG: glycerol-3-phosphate 1-O-acyltransferase PlsY [Dehalococcoidales bacterium]|nr:glycerol-3-phosphate 1-O-acyltransferase PlsY [Dehalococcoidales bacterium]
MIIAKFILVAFIGYLLGSIPFGVIVGKYKAKIDIRNFGSGKTGGTNVLRTLGRRAFLMVAALDVLKGALAVVMAGIIIGSESVVVGHYGGLGLLFAQVIAALAAVIGHIWPIFIKFKGGRGVATFIGGLIALCPVAGFFGGEALIIGAGLSGFASLGSIIGVVGAYAILVPLTLFYGFPIEYLLYVLIGTLLILFMHRDNIKRLMSGKERKLNQKAKPVESPTGKDNLTQPPAGV